MRQLIIAAMLVGGAGWLQADDMEPKVVKVLARITYYDGRDDEFGKKTATGVRAREGETVAVDFRVIPPGSIIKIPELEGVVGDGIYTAQDTGTDVRSRKAARVSAKKLLRSGEISRAEYKEYSMALVIDVHVNRNMNRRSREQPEFMMVEIQI